MFCGDLNAIVGFATYRRLTRVLSDTQSAVKMSCIPRTWFSRYPISRFDHIFLSPDIAVQEVMVPRTTPAQTASDHLPLLVEISLSDEAVGRT